ncbi:negative regulator of systemic acquired resistance SNI1-like [Rosa rugosa]|uniref:negative regulator of systemic acquired resistance SNI1-like n=1 Tax=Rosa rugosa TaxID=74645 RepID=UPI002B4144E8|nr:negative regulator of systemic acquired resistance SNI1-like [Rosa rugosa]
MFRLWSLTCRRRIAEMQRSTTRADGVRSPLLEMVLYELTYDKDILSTFLQVDHIIRAENMMAAQEIIKLFAELISIRRLKSAVLLLITSSKYIAKKLGPSVQ